MKKPFIAILGSGNLAFNLSLALKKNGYAITDIYSRNKKEGKKLASLISSSYTDDLSKISSKAEIYFFCITDSSIEEVAKKLNRKDKILVHCSGGTSIDILGGKSDRFAVFYPVQSFNKGMDLNWKEIPVCVEGSSEEVSKLLLTIAGKLSKAVFIADSEARKQIHLAAVFANNFSNACFMMSNDLLKEAGIPFSILRPLILNTALKVQQEEPVKVQTGPAVRNDSGVIKKHLAMLNSNPELKNLYKEITTYISSK